MAHTYTDINLNFLKNPSTFDVAKKYDVEAVKSSVKNILQTNKGEKLFKPEFGANLQNLLFELITPPVKLLAKKQIVEEIEKWEPRISISNVVISTDDEAMGALIVTVEFYVIADTPTPAAVTIKLERAR